MELLSTCIVIEEILGAQTPLLIVHCKTFVPVGKPVTELFGDVVFVIMPLPYVTDHVPEPTSGVFAFKTVVLFKTQSVCVGPAFEIVGTWSTCICTVDVVGEQPTVPIFHCNVFIPKPKLVTVLFGEFTEVTVPLPETTLQVPVPTPGVLPLNVVDAELIQTV